MRYKGDIIAVTLLGKISKGKVEGTSEIKELAAIYRRDLMRVKIFKKIEHKNFARFGAVFKHQGDIQQGKSFDSVRSNSRFFAIQQRKDGLIKVLGDRSPKNNVDGLIEHGINMRGVLPIWTKAKVIKNNAPLVRQGSTAVYQWTIRTMRDPLPAMILQL